MSFDDGLAERIREVFQNRHDVAEKKMFGGLAFMISGHMCCGIIGEKLMLRVGAGQYDELLQKKHASAMDFTGKPMKGMLYIEPEGIAEDQNLSQWIGKALDFVSTLPPK